MASQTQGKKAVLDIRTWEQAFQELMQQEKPRATWTLTLDEKLEPEYLPEGWKQYQQKGFGRFQCSSCRRNWASAQVHILCHMHLEPRKSQGQVIMRLFAQRCQKCSWSRFENPEFSPESAMRILKNVVRRILEKFYGNGFRKFPELPIIREVPLDGSHDTKNCEACTLGCCSWRSQNNMTEPPISPSSYLDIMSSSCHMGDVDSKNQECGSIQVFKDPEPSHTNAETQVPGAGIQPTWETSKQPTPMTDREAPEGNSQSTQETAPQTPWRTYSEVLRLARQQSTQQSRSQATWTMSTMIRSYTQTRGRTAPSALGSHLHLTPRTARGFVIVSRTQATWRRSHRYAVPNTGRMYLHSMQRDTFSELDVFFYLWICIVLFFVFVGKNSEAEGGK
ncbi:receptor-transporting protein 4 isoform X1 [Lontra canadensis]|uniref:receptor-transporting protein 4 isoform X1 n=1 Tax=Lontra canadensis TaxID=76717 RepID=UPI0013F32002|nr:receptor-transporting protein 4 isoform X1 [Lontra canadensis]